MRKYFEKRIMVILILVLICGLLSGCGIGDNTPYTESEVLDLVQMTYGENTTYDGIETGTVTASYGISDVTIYNFTSAEGLSFQVTSGIASSRYYCVPVCCKYLESNYLSLLIDSHRSEILEYQERYKLTGDWEESISGMQYFITVQNEEEVKAAISMLDDIYRLLAQELPLVDENTAIGLDGTLPVYLECPYPDSTDTRTICCPDLITWRGMEVELSKAIERYNEETTTGTSAE